MSFSLLILKRILVRFDEKNEYIISKKSLSAVRFTKNVVDLFAAIIKKFIFALDNTISAFVTYTHFTFI